MRKFKKKNSQKFENDLKWPTFRATHCGLKVSRSQAKIYKNFVNYFLKTKANNKCSVVLNVHVKGYRKA